MSELTPAASLAWKIAAAEAGGARHRFIERGHFLIGLLSLSKIVHDAPVGLELPRLVKEDVARENARLEELLARLSLRATALRRALRAALGPGAHDPDGRPISRSASLRIAFRHARALAKGGPVDCVHLLAAVLEAPDPPLARALSDAQAQARDLYQQALASTRAAAGGPADAIRALEAKVQELFLAVRKKQGVVLRITPEAAAFVAEQASRTPQTGQPLEPAIERWIKTPLNGIVRSGKIRDHLTWQFVYDEGGVYLLPDEDA